MLGYVRRDQLQGTSRPPEGPIPIVDPTGGGPLIWIVPVPEPKAVKNRMHFDVFGRTQELLDAGATLVRARDEEIEWDVLADPESNEFCVFAPPETGLATPRSTAARRHPPPPETLCAGSSRREHRGQSK